MSLLSPSLLLATQQTHRHDITKLIDYLRSLPKEDTFAGEFRKTNSSSSQSDIRCTTLFKIVIIFSKILLPPSRESY
jgi:hypothetical protein